MNSLTFRTAAPLIVAATLVFAIFVFLRGHNEPGGGFIAGLIAAAGMAVHGFAAGPEAVLRALRLPPLSIAGLGVSLAAASGLVSLLFGAPYLTASWTFFHLGETEIGISTPLFFDLGVFFTVFGTVSAIFLGLEAEGGET